MTPNLRRSLLSLAAGSTVIAGTLTLGAPARAAAVPAHVGGLSPVTNLRGLVDLGPAEPTAKQTVTLALALRDRAGLDTLAAAQATPSDARFRQWLSVADFNARYAPTAAAVSTARSFAAAHGLTVSSISPDNTVLTLSGTTAQINGAFGVVEHTLTAAGQTFLSPDRTATLPSSLAAVTKSVLGLSTFQTFSRPLSVRASSPYQTYGIASYGPEDFAQIYDEPTDFQGEGQKVGVITAGDLTQVQKDLVTFEDKHSLKHVPLVGVPSLVASSDTSGQDEYDLDTQYATGFAPNVNAVVAYNAAALGDISALSDYANQSDVRTASASYGGCEALNYLVGDVDADDQEFLKIQTTGKTLFVSSGDEGSGCSVIINTGTPAGVPDVEYPSSSPYVVSVGGTSLTGQSTQPTREIAWLGGGGGYSQFESAPSWQASSIESQPALGFRAQPDVSLDADSFSGYNVIVSGTEEPIGGTSASTPAWNGIWARVLQAKGTGIGTAAPALYRNASLLTDITLGTNGLWAATPGYDLSTGLGSADVSKLVHGIH